VRYKSEITWYSSCWTIWF